MDDGSVKIYGAGHSITGINMTDSTKEYTGLIGYSLGATVQNLTVFGTIHLEKPNGSRMHYAGGVCACSEGGIFSNCNNKININILNSNSTQENYVYAGGIVGFWGLSDVIECTNEGAVKAEAYAMEKTNYDSFVSAGGLVGAKSKNDEVNGNNLSKDISANGNEFVQIHTGDLVGRSIG